MTYHGKTLICRFITRTLWKMSCCISNNFFIIQPNSDWPLEANSTFYRSVVLHILTAGLECYLTCTPSGACQKRRKMLCVLLLLLLLRQLDVCLVSSRTCWTPKDMTLKITVFVVICWWVFLRRVGKSRRRSRKPAFLLHWPVAMYWHELKMALVKQERTLFLFWKELTRRQTLCKVWMILHAVGHRSARICWFLQFHIYYCSRLHSFSSSLYSRITELIEEERFNECSCHSTSSHELLGEMRYLLCICS